MTTISKISAELKANLGGCPRCMRQSFIFMLGSWGLMLVVTFVANSPLVLGVGGAIAVGATGLWLSHLAVFTLGALRRGGPSRGAAFEGDAVTDISGRPRRQFILAFSKIFLFAAAATALPAGAAFAQDRVNPCLACCASRLNACGSGGNCNVLYKNCVLNCNTGGWSPS